MSQLDPHTGLPVSTDPTILANNAAIEAKLNKAAGIDLSTISGSNSSPSSGSDNIRANSTALTNTDSSIGLIDPLKDENVAARATEIEQARNAINTQTQADLAAIDAAGEAAGLEYNPLITAAQDEQRTGMAKAVVTAGQRGGLMNTQFAGEAAAVLTPEAKAALQTLKNQGFDVQTPGNESWVGKGGELANIRDVYSANISKIQVLQKQAIAAARSAAMKYQRDGRIENYNLAKDLYEQAKGLINDSNDLKIQQAEAERNAKADARAEKATQLNLDEFDFEKTKYAYELANPEIKTSTRELMGADGLMHAILYNTANGATIADMGATENITSDMQKKYKDVDFSSAKNLKDAIAILKTSKLYQDEIRGPVGTVININSETGLTPAQTTAAEAKYMALNASKGKTRDDFNKLSSAEKLMWYGGGPELSPEEKKAQEAQSAADKEMQDVINKQKDFLASIKGDWETAYNTLLNRDKTLGNRLTNADRDLIYQQTGINYGPEYETMIDILLDKPSNYNR